MADYNSSLPVRTEDAGDVIIKIADSLVPSQQAQVTAARELSVLASAQPGVDIGDVTVNNGAGAAAVNIQDGGNSITVDATDLDIRDLSSATDSVTVVATDLDIRDLAFATDKVDASGSAVSITGSVVVTATNLDIRDLSSATDSVTAIQGTDPWLTKDAADGPAAPGVASAFSQLAGGIYNATPLTVADGQQASLQIDAAGRLLISSSGSSISVSNFPSTVDVNYGTVGASTIRTAAEIGNATGAADFAAGATGAQTLRVVANQGAANATPWNENIAQIAGAAPSATNSLPVHLSDGAAFYSDSNPVPVKFAQEGTAKADFKMASAIASGASDNHDYTAIGAFMLNQVEAAGSGKAKMIISIETGVATGTFTTRFVQFNSTAETNMSIIFADPLPVAAGVRVRVSMSNRDLLAQDLYSTICGLET